MLVLVRFSSLHLHHPVQVVPASRAAFLEGLSQSDICRSFGMLVSQYSNRSVAILPCAIVKVLDTSLVIHRSTVSRPNLNLSNHGCRDGGLRVMALRRQSRVLWFLPKVSNEGSS
jgi:hypothetical protein